MSVFYHCPKGVGRPHARAFWRFADSLLNEGPVFAPPSNVHFVTYDDRDEPHKWLLQRFFEKHTLSHSVVARGWQPWNWYAKVLPVFELLSSGAVTTEYVCVADGRDVAIAGDPATLPSVLTQYDARLLFCGTCSNWPPHAEARDFESARAPHAPGRQHLSAGVFFGHTEYVLECLRSIVEACSRRSADDKWALYRGRFDDQHAWRMLHLRNYPVMRVDSEGTMCRRYDVFV